MSYLNRVVASIEDKQAWWKARANAVSSSEASLLAKDSSVSSVLRQKQLFSSFAGNRYTEHGNTREPEIQRWISEEYDIPANKWLFHSEYNARFLATPDGLKETNDGLVLAEIKTTKRDFTKIPPKYLRQIHWQQYVLGAERTLFVWEVHENFEPVTSPQCLWVPRDDELIDHLVRRASRVLELLDAQQDFGDTLDDYESLWHH